MEVLLEPILKLGVVLMLLYQSELPVVLARSCRLISE